MNRGRTGWSESADKGWMYCTLDLEGIHEVKSRFIQSHVKNKDDKRKFGRSDPKLNGVDSKGKMTERVKKNKK